MTNMVWSHPECMSAVCHHSLKVLASKNFLFAHFTYAEKGLHIVYSSRRELCVWRVHSSVVVMLELLPIQHCVLRRPWLTSYLADSHHYPT